MASEPTPTQEAFRRLPSIDEALRDGDLVALEDRVGRDLLKAFVQRVLGEWRMQILDGQLDAEGLQERLDTAQLLGSVRHLALIEEGRGVRPAINVAGIVLNTGLGRAPVHPEVAQRMGAAAGGYCVLEVDRFTGQRNRRDDRLSELLLRLTGAEAGIAVNNNAAAALLCMHTFAKDREAIVSRGELVEIGGSFRVPDVMAAANARLVEVGATNRTRIGDYAKAIGADTGLLMKVHPSNFRIIGFTEEVDPADLAKLGAEHGVTSAWDLGSGLVEPANATMLGPKVGGETEVATAVASGVDVVTFSGDKLLGGPQAGMLVGKRATIEALRKNPLYRALRCDKVQLAGLEATIELLLAGRGDELPTRALLCRDVEDVRAVSHALAKELGALGFTCEVVDSPCQPGSGSAPGIELPSSAVQVSDPNRSPDRLAAALRAGTPPVFARVQEDRLWVDPRTLLDGQHELLVEAFRQLT